MRRKAVAISRLADYASDPEGYIKRRGKVRSVSAARAGTRHHDALGRQPSIWRWALILGLLAAAAYLLAHGGF